MIKKIGLGGAIQIGKSTIVEKLLKNANVPVYGFMTELDRGTVDGAGMFPLYIYPAGMPKSERVKSEENLLGACAGRNRHKAYTEQFDKLATALISDVPKGSIIVMDELGFLESEAENFKKKVMEILASDYYVIAVIKDRFDVDFLNDLRALDEIDYYRVSEENRDRLAEELIEIVKGWK